MAALSDIARSIIGEVTSARLVARLRAETEEPAAGDERGDPARLLTLLMSPALVERARALPGAAGAIVPAGGQPAPRGDLPVPAGTAPGLRVLVIDDEEGVCLALAHMMRSQGCEVGTASCARDAMAILPRGWDMAVLDLMLPDANGLELIPRLRGENPGIDVVIATAFGTMESAVEALRRGASDFMMKPFTLAEVARVVARGAQRGALLRERAGLVERLERTVFELQLLSQVSRAAQTTFDLRDLVAIFIEALPEVLRPDLARAWAAGPDGVLSWDVGRSAAGGSLAPAARAVESEILVAFGRATNGAPASSGVPVPVTGTEVAAAPAEVTWIAVPFVNGEDLGGLVTLVWSRREGFPPEDAALLYRVAETASLAVERGREQLESQVRRMESVMGAMGDGVVMTDARGVPNVVNPAARVLLGLPLDGDPAHLMDRSAAARGVLAHLRAALARREGSTTREFLLEGDPPRKLAVQSGLVTDDRSEARGIVALLEDVTRRREFDLLQSEFVSAVSHELRTPLSCVRNYVDMVLDRRAGELTANQERFLATARRNVDRLTHMIDNLLSLSRSEEVRADASHEAVDLSGLARSLAESVRADAAERGVTIELQLPVERLEVRGDRERLTQALGLLVRQAVRVSGRGSTIEILGARVNRGSLRPPPDESEALAGHARWVHLSLRLLHTQVSPVEARDLFRRFRPSRGVEGRPLAASGLDLALARNLVEAHEGHLWAEVRDADVLHLELILPVVGPSPRQGELLERVRALLERSRREGVSMSVLVFRLGRPLAQAADHDELADVDAALRVVAGILRVSLRQEDRLFANRAVGELVLLLERTDSRGIAVVCDRVAARLRALEASQPGPLAGFIAELGWSTFPQDGVTAQEIMALARRRCVPVDARPPSAPRSEGGALPCLTQES